MKRGRLATVKPPGPPTEYIEIDPGELSGVFTAPEWLRDAGMTSWLLVGVALLGVGLIWLLALTQTIVAPGDHRGDRRRGRFAAGRLAAATTACRGRSARR